MIRLALTLVAIILAIGFAIGVILVVWITAPFTP